MCRILAQLSVKPQAGEPYLTKSPWSLLVQSYGKPSRLQEDGWGVAWYPKEGGSPKLVRSTKAVFRERERFSQVAHTAVSRILITHIRAASNPLGLPMDRVLRRENTQPFVSGSWTFAHNGTLHLMREVCAQLGGATLKLEGENDSELLFHLFLESIKRSDGGFKYAVHQMMMTLEQVWRAHRSGYPKLRWIASGMNFVASNGSQFVAFCHWVPRPSQKSSLGLGTQPFFQMSYHPLKERLIVASEPTDRDPSWYPIPQGHLLTAGIHDGALNYSIEKIVS